jgi:hypothetical protein
MSKTVAATLALVPFAPVMVLPPVPFTVREIVCTGHVINGIGALVVSAMAAVICVSPGACAVTLTCPLGIPKVFSGVTVATFG